MQQCLENRSAFAEVSEEPLRGGVASYNKEGFRRKDPVEVKVWQWLVRFVTHNRCGVHVFVQNLNAFSVPNARSVCMCVRVCTAK